MLRVAAVMLLLWTLAPAATGQADAPGPRAEGAFDEGNPRAVVELVSGAKQVVAGEDFEAGVRFELDPGWHVYWHNPGEGAMATQVDWSGEGLRFDELGWPAPERFEQSGFIVTYGYAEEVVLPVRVKVDASASNQVSVRAVADFLVCKVECIPDRLSVERTLPVGPERRSDPEGRALLSRYRARVPVAAEQAGVQLDVRVEPPVLQPGRPFEAEMTFRCTGRDACKGLAPPAGGAEHAFYPDPTGGIDLTPARMKANDDGSVTLELEGETSPDPPEQPRRLSGVLVLSRAKSSPLRVRIDTPLPGGSEPKAGGGQAKATTTADRASGGTDDEAPLSLGQAVLFALLGGLLLNLMPCVLPVLAIKAFGLMRLAGEGLRPRALHGLAYTGGILGTFAALAGLVVALRAGGTELGWGFQLQQPLFVALLAAVLLVFALSLFGVLRFSVNAEGIAARVDRSGGLARSAGEGVLAVIVATPCTAPFLGTAVGFALTGGTALVLSVFLAVGLGLAAPFLVLVLVPGAHRLLPRPGAWMHRLEAVLGFALLATVIWLIWLLGQVAGTEGIVKLLIFLLTVALGSWILGTWGFDLQASRRTRTLATWTALALVAATGTATLRFSSPRASAATSTDGFWTEWSPQAVDRALTEKRVVFVDFTADWCITCKVNEATVLERGRVAEALAAEGVAALKADWTERDARIRRALQRHGRAGVPLYLVFSPGQANDPQVLPEVLTADMVLDALRKARKQSKDDESA